MTGQKRIFIWEIVFKGEREDSRKPSHCGQDCLEFKIHWVWRRGTEERGLSACIKNEVELEKRSNLCFFRKVLR